MALRHPGYEVGGGEGQLSFARPGFSRTCRHERAEVVETSSGRQANVRRCPVCLRIPELLQRDAGELRFGAKVRRREHVLPASRGEMAEQRLLVVLRRGHAAVSAIVDSERALAGAEDAATALKLLARARELVGKALHRVTGARRGAEGHADPDHKPYGRFRDSYDPLWRCKFCQSLVFKLAREEHLRIEHKLPSSDVDTHFDQARKRRKQT